MNVGFKGRDIRLLAMDVEFLSCNFLCCSRFPNSYNLLIMASPATSMLALPCRCHRSAFHTVTCSCSEKGSALWRLTSSYG